MNMPPVQINRCVLVYTPTYSQRYSGYTAGPLYITFTNVSGVPATYVRIGVQTPKRTLSIPQTGTFSPGVKIAHAYSQLDKNLPDYAPRPEPNCTVQSVRFSDGTAWNAPSAAP
jgi:hypothetical protein